MRCGTFWVMFDALMTGICYCKKNIEYNLKLSSQILKFDKSKFNIPIL